MKEIIDFIAKLNEERTVINAKLRFVNEHKFTKEEAYLRDKLNTINTILFELESVTKGQIKGIDSKFIWM